MEQGPRGRGVKGPGENKKSKLEPWNPGTLEPFSSTIHCSRFTDHESLPLATLHVLF
jgi:hypothetical protein